ncbi:MAG: GNAT family N-acetyltransferase, partial [Nitrososphaerales archaeon]
GCFADGRLLAASSGYRRAGFMDLGVLTHPGFRGQGLGKAVAGALCAWCAEQGVIAQYRCNTTNAASQALARALNFRLFFHSESLWLTA